LVSRLKLVDVARFVGTISEHGTDRPVFAGPDGKAFIVFPDLELALLDLVTEHGPAVVAGDPIQRHLRAHTVSSKGRRVTESVL
jgi:hypothetical protein